eukprot:2069565-Alexandrium_andersonii.AAC.1
MNPRRASAPIASALGVSEASGSLFAVAASEVLVTGARKSAAGTMNCIATLSTPLPRFRGSLPR